MKDGEGFEVRTWGASMLIGEISRQVLDLPILIPCLLGGRGGKTATLDATFFCIIKCRVTV